MWMPPRTAGLFAFLIVANIAAWAWAVFSDCPALLGTALLAWVFGRRHAFDADYIAAVDNTVHKLTHEGQRPASVGFFSLGHSTVVVLASIAVAAAAALMQDPLEATKAVGGVIGTVVSATFLLAIAIGNLNHDLSNPGFRVVGIFALRWIASTVIYRWLRFGELESCNPVSGPSPAALLLEKLQQGSVFCLTHTNQLV